MITLKPHILISLSWSVILAASGNQCLADSATVETNPPTLGRLFYSYAERRTLSHTKLGESGESKMGEAQQDDSRLEFSGFIMRADGSYQVWINGRSQLSPNGAPVRYGRPDKRTQSARLYLEDASIELKPGQVWLETQGKIQEAYQAPAANQTKTPASTEDAITPPEATSADTDSQ